MGDNIYQYPVALQWDQGPEELKKIKNKLQPYFGIKNKSGGGDCEIRDTDCTRGYILIYYKDKEAPQRVVQKSPHELVIDGTRFSLRVSLPDAVNTQKMGNPLSSLVASSDGASGSSADADQHQEDNQNPERRKRENSSMTNSDFRNGDQKRGNRKDCDDRDDSTRHGEWEKDRRDVGAPEGEEKDNDSSTPRSLTDREDQNPEGSAIPRNDSGRNFRRLLSQEGKSRPADHREDGAYWSSVDKDYQPEHYRNSDIQGKEYSSWTDSGLMDGFPKRPEDHFTRQGEQREDRSDVGIDRNIQYNISSAPRQLRENGDKSSGDFFTARNESRRNSLGRAMSMEEPRRNRPAAPPEIFEYVTAILHTDWFTKDLQEEIKAEIPSLTLEEKYNVVKVKGTFKEIETMYHYFQGIQEQKLGAEKPPDTLNDWSPTDSQADQVCVPSALYEYIMEIHRAEMDKIERSYGVKIDHRSRPEGSTYVRFIPQGSGSSPEKAKEIFTDKVQKGMDDWSQVTVDPSVVPLTISDIKQRVADRWSNTQVIQGENKDIILRGPRDELSQVKMFLEKGDHKPARPPRAVTISTSNMKTEIEVDPRHMDILKKLKQREISDIEKKYNVNIKEKKKNGSVLITFKSMNAALDLSPHASHSFITLLQKTFFNIEKKVIRVKPEIQEGEVNILQEQLMMAGIVIVMEYSKGTVLLIGHPVHVAFAEEKLNGSQNPGRGQTGATSGEKMDTSSPSTNTQKTEEPDTCPICMCEIEDKAILDKCKHAYCKGCLKELMAHKPVCAICGVSYGIVTGDQPDGTMSVNTNRNYLPGYPRCGTIEIHYSIPSGIQKENHPRPGRPFHGAHRTAYLPDNKEGNEILHLLRKAFDQRLIFTVGDSRTTGATDTVTWNDIHHKTSTTGGPQNFGYPDPDYLNRVRDELKAKGVE